MGVGASGIRPPSVPAVSDSQAGRITDLERKRVLNDRPQRVQFEWVDGWSGTVVAMVFPRYYIRWSARLTPVFFSLATAGSTATTFKVYRNGSVLTPVTVDSNMTIVSTTTLSLTGTNHSGVAQFDAQFSKDDYITVEVVSAGTGATDVRCQERFG